MNYRRSRDPIVVPYPYLTDGAVLNIGSIPNTYKQLPVDETTASYNTWYKPAIDRDITIVANKTLLIVRDSGSNSQIIIWDTAPVDAPQVRSIVSTDYIMVYDGIRVPLSIAGFPVFTLGDNSEIARSNSFILLPSNIGFDFKADN